MTRQETAEAPRVSHRGRAVVLIGLTTFFTVAALAHVWVRLQIVRLGYEICQETEREKRLQQLHRKLQVERALLRNPERLERLARERLDLIMPDPDIIRVLKPGSRDDRPARAARAAGGPGRKGLGG